MLRDVGRSTKTFDWGYSKWARLRGTQLLAAEQSLAEHFGLYRAEPATTGLLNRAEVSVSFAAEQLEPSVRERVRRFQRGEHPNVSWLKAT